MTLVRALAGARAATVRTVAVAAVAAVVACGKGGDATSPSADPTTLTGTWSGAASDSSGPGTMSWQITQNGNSFSGPMTANDPSQGVTGRGTVSGTVSGSSFQFSMTVPVGGFDGAYTGCTSTVSGNGTVSSSSINGTYAGTSTCPPGNAISGGTLALNKQ